MTGIAGMPVILCISHGSEEPCTPPAAVLLRNDEHESSWIEIRLVGAMRPKTASGAKQKMKPTTGLSPAELDGLVAYVRLFALK